MQDMFVRYSAAAAAPSTSSGSKSNSAPWVSYPASARSLRAVRADVRGVAHASLVFTPLDGLSGEVIPPHCGRLELRGGSRGHRHSLALPHLARYKRATTTSPVGW